MAKAKSQRDQATTAEDSVQGNGEVGKPITVAERIEQLRARKAEAHHAGGPARATATAQDRRGPALLGMRGRQSRRAYSTLIFR